MFRLPPSEKRKIKEEVESGIRERSHLLSPWNCFHVSPRALAKWSSTETSETSSVIITCFWGATGMTAATAGIGFGGEGEGGGVDLAWLFFAANIAWCWWIWFFLWCLSMLVCCCCWCLWACRAASCCCSNCSSIIRCFCKANCSCSNLFRIMRS